MNILSKMSKRLKIILGILFVLVLITVGLNQKHLLIIYKDESHGKNGQYNYNWMIFDNPVDLEIYKGEGWSEFRGDLNVRETARITNKKIVRNIIREIVKFEEILDYTVEDYVRDSEGFEANRFRVWIRTIEEIEEDGQRGGPIMMGFTFYEGHNIARSYFGEEFYYLDEEFKEYLMSFINE
ncbi:hypothetical protein HYG86_17990 [Alkalicella caledoniensis]|uniref:Uncharacterized protein n=1 Tax=Alkalicella caledoniensis TaxID=2731377 RepID=A0A7G9WCW7_ALKCA|nr:hypothetical protein [Alkalicella caledoniensis]QNO16529.1 hypothetical protein HYG86_17990 [Alkalicella caledoniensis]